VETRTGRKVAAVRKRPAKATFSCSFIEDEAGVSMDASCSPDEMDEDLHDGYDDSFVDDLNPTQHSGDE